MTALVEPMPRRLTIRTRTANALDGYFQTTPSGNTLMYTLTLSYLLFTAYLLGAWPQYYWLLHNVTMFILFPMQYCFFRKDKYHYFFFEFCYSVNYYGTIVTFAALAQWLLPIESPGMITKWLTALNSTAAVRGFFLLCTGPVLIATKSFGFAIFFHDLREVCSCWMHFSPAVVAYTFRWHSEAIHATFPGMFKFNVDEPLSYYGLVDVYHAAVYYIFAWAIPYYIMLWMVRDRLVQKGYKMLIHCVCEGDMLKSFPVEQRPMIYIFGHFILSVLAMMLSILWWQFKPVHFAFVSFLFFSMIWNGGYRYWEVAKLPKVGRKPSKVQVTLDASGEVVIKKNK